MSLFVSLGTLALCFSNATAIMQTDGGSIATRITSTFDLTTNELKAYNLQGNFRGYLGTPIDPTHFLTAQHIGIDPSDTITFSQGPNVGTYAISTWYDDPSSDLRIIEITSTFSSWAQIYAASDEVGKSFTIFGRGGIPIGNVFVAAELKGWTASAPDGQASWGRNIVTGSFGLDQIYARFDRNGLVDEAGLTVGDSGGGWFIEDAVGVTRLAAISFAVSGPFQHDQAGAPDGNLFEAALYDIGGLWLGNLGSETFIPENPVDTAGVAFGTRISARIGWIEGIVPIASADTDADGVPDSQDNCPYFANPSQSDSGGHGFGNTPDGIGDACQCGDITGEGQVNDTDATFIKRWALGLFAPLFLVPDNCDVNGDGICGGTDGTLVRHAAIGNPPAIFGQNCPSALP